MSALVYRQIASITDAMQIMAVRNSGHAYMTHDSREITASEQHKWYNEIYLPKNKNGEMFAYCGYEQGNPVAYGMIQKKDDRYWVTGVISPECRGKGYGKELFRLLRDLVISSLSPDVYLDVLRTNERAVSLYEKLGFENIGDGRKLVQVMRWGAK